MKLNHINLTVSDVPAMKELFIKYFGMRPNEAANGNRGFDMVFDDDGMVITLIKAGKSKPLEYPATFHIGFIQPSHEAVNEINQWLKADGFDVPEPSSMHGSWTFYFTSPGGFVIEVLA